MTIAIQPVIRIDIRKDFRISRTVADSMKNRAAVPASKKEKSSVNSIITVHTNR